MGNQNNERRPIVIAGPCVAESFDMLLDTAKHLFILSQSLQFDLVFKASFDKANRTSIDGYRGPGMDTCLKWFADLKTKLPIKILTDVHETNQVNPTASVCEYLQIPAFLCRQTDLLIAAVKTGRIVNIKKGQFMAPQAMAHIVKKAIATSQKQNEPLKIMLTERGTTFGYGNLVVDMRSFAIMASSAGARVPILLDITHSTQLPPASEGEGGKTSGAQREFAPLLSRAATATGYLSGYFLEVHPEPASAKSDSSSQLSFTQTEILLKQIIPLWRTSSELVEIDRGFKN